MSGIPDKVNEVLKDYFYLIKPYSLDLLDAFYIYGSVSMDAFINNCSDIDFIGVVKRNISPEELDILKIIHAEVKKKHHSTDLMGYYVKRSDLQSEYANTKDCLCFIEGIFKGYEKFEINSIDAFQLKKYGITILGPGVENLNYTVDWDRLEMKIRNELCTYWLDYVNNPSIRYKGLFDLAVIEWVVLGVSRSFYNIKEKNIISKIGAGEYALQTFPQKWHDIIKESMRLRIGNRTSYFRSVFKRRKHVLDYVKFIIAESNKLFMLYLISIIDGFIII